MAEEPERRRRGGEIHHFGDERRPGRASEPQARDPEQVERDVQDQKGNYIARRGQTVNPLDFTAVTQALVFVDGDNDAEMPRWNELGRRLCSAFLAEAGR